MIIYSVTNNIIILFYDIKYILLNKYKNGNKFITKYYEFNKFIIKFNLNKITLFLN